MWGSHMLTYMSRSKKNFVQMVLCFHLYVSFRDPSPVVKRGVAPV